MGRLRGSVTSSGSSNSELLSIRLLERRKDRLAVQCFCVWLQGLSGAWPTPTQPCGPQTVPPALARDCFTPRFRAPRHRLPIGAAIFVAPRGRRHKPSLDRRDAGGKKISLFCPHLFETDRNRFAAIYLDSCAPLLSRSPLIPCILKLPRCVSCV